ncbi:MAG: GNAT family N-acetyltransferase [Candidatus Bathycorpusculaceae bacterium]
MVIIKKADSGDIRALSIKLLSLLEDKKSKVYVDNVVKFGIPEEYVKKAFAKETIEKAVEEGKATFYIAFERNNLLGFAQTIQKNAYTAELDRIVVFPPHERKGIGTQLLRYAFSDLKRKGVENVLVVAGKKEMHARRFYEKNGFKLIEENIVDTPWGKKLNIITYQLHLGRNAE